MMATGIKKEGMAPLEEFFEHLNVVDMINRAYSFKDK